MLARIARFAAGVAVVGFAAFALLLLAVRFVVFPQVESYRSTLADALARQLGRPVEIAVLATGWDGWNPKLVIEGFRVLDRERSTAPPLIELPRVELVVAWTSLPRFELYLKELVIERPRLAIRRDRAGMVHVAGIEFDPAQAPDDPSFTDWLLRQRQIVVRDALVTWNDDLRNAPQLVLDRVQFRLHNRYGRHRFGLKGEPPAELAAPIEVRGDIRGISQHDWQNAQGALYVRLDFADVAAWREWLPLPGPIASGKGALRLWLELGKGDTRDLVADLELADVSAQLDEHLPRLDLSHLAGRIGWRSGAGRREIFARDLALETVDGQRLGPTDLKLALDDAGDARKASGRLDFDHLELAPLRELAAHLPLAADVRANLARFSPRGTLTHVGLRWEGAADAPDSYAVAAQFADLGVLPHDAFPGVSGLSGRVDADQDKGTLKLASRNVALALPNVYPEAVALDTVDGTFGWERKAGTTTVRADKLEFTNADLAAEAAGTWRSAASGSGSVELNARLSRVDLGQVHRYVPATAKEGLRHWLQTAFAGGSASDFRLRVAGNLDDLPFARGKAGQFVVTAKAKDLVLDYAKRWPRIEGLDADFRIDGARLTIDAARGRVFGAAIGRTRAQIVDLGAEFPVLRIDGTATGSFPDFLQFVAESPVAEWTGHLTDGAEAAGDGHLKLGLALALGRVADSKVAGEFTVTRASLRLPNVPPLTRLDGTLSFSETQLRARDLGAEVLGGPAKVSVTSADARVQVSASGSAPLAQVRREIALAHLDRVSGTIDWTIGVNVRPEFSTWVLESTLKGVGIDLPPPFAKAPAETVSLRVERRGDEAHPGEDSIVASYGRTARFVAHRRLGPSGARVDRALLSLGRAADLPGASRADRPGMWMRADLSALDVDDWLVWLRRDKKGAAGSAGAEADVSFDGVDLAAGQVDAFGVRFHDLDASARRVPDGWQLELKGPELAGSATWAAPRADLPTGRIVARLERFGIPGRGEPGARPDAAAKDRGAQPANASALDNAWPELDIIADSLVSRGRDLGHLELRARPRGGEWHIERLALTNEGGTLEANGEWRVFGQQQQTRLDVALDAKEAGAFLTRFGHADAVHGAPTRINGHLVWSGAPLGLDYPTLSGDFRIEVGGGRFTRIEPGFGKLLGVLSLQSLPRRVTLDFRDVFSDGFAFDDVNGTVRIANGVMSTNDLKLVGPAARVNIAGEVDIAAETQRLTVRVQPSLSSSVSAGAALLFFANPLVGAAIGAGSLLAQKVLQDPIEQMFSYQYTVTGSWSDPVVTRSGSATASVAPGAPGAPAEGATR